MKKTISKILLTGLIVVFSMGSVVSAAGVDYGSSGAFAKDSYTIGQMLTYAMQDEYLARAEYEKIMETYGEQNPFSNIIKSEETHIALLKPLFEKYRIAIPEDTAKERTIVPDSLTGALKTGVQAEIDNIAMYEKFLKQDLPEDIERAFISLKNASQNHLRAFENGVDRENGNKGNNTGRKGFRGRNR